jgi:hypothetical protein
MACHAINHLTLKSLVCLSFESSKASAIFFKRDQSLLNLLLKSMKVSCSVMIQTLAHIVFSTWNLAVLKSLVTWCLMRPTAPKWSNLILIL